MPASSPIRPPQAGSDLGEPSRSRTAGSGASGMTGASGSAMEWWSYALEREHTWAQLERWFLVSAAKFGSLALVSVVALFWLSAEPAFAVINGGLFWFCVGNAVLSAVEADECRRLYQRWRAIRDELHAATKVAA